MGIAIIPQKYEIRLIKSNEIITEATVIEGRKILSRATRIKMLKNHQKYMWIYLEVKNPKEKNEILKFLRNADEYYLSFNELIEAEVSDKIAAMKQTRITFSNHRHLMIMVACMSNPAVYLTQKYFSLYGKHINIQSVLEKPYHYILARCRSDDSQLRYPSERLDDILNLKDDAEHNRKHVRDIARISKGDNSAYQL